MKLTKIFRWLLAGSLLFYILVLVLLLTSKISFGHGLGDLLFLYLLIGAVILLSIVITIVFTWDDLKMRPLSFTIFSSILLLATFFMIRAFTVDRGSMEPWDGKVFISR